MLKWFHFCFIHTVILLQQIIFDFGASLTHSRWRALSYRNQSIDVLWKSVDWFLYDRDFPYERAKLPLLRKKMWEIVLCVRYAVGKVLIHDEILRFQVVLFFIVHRNTFVSIVCGELYSEQNNTKIKAWSLVTNMKELFFRICFSSKIFYHLKKLIISGKRHMN